MHAGALFIPLILIVAAAKMIIHIPRHHILKLNADGAIEPLIIQIKPGHVHKHLGNEHLTRDMLSLQNAKLWTWSLSLNIQSEDSDPLHVPFVMNVINIPRQQFLTTVNLAHHFTIYTNIAMTFKSTFKC